MHAERTHHEDRESERMWIYFAAKQTTICDSSTTGNRPLSSACSGRWCRLDLLVVVTLIDWLGNWLGPIFMRKRRRKLFSAQLNSLCVEKAIDKHNMTASFGITDTHTHTLSTRSDIFVYYCISALHSPAATFFISQWQYKRRTLSRCCFA